MNGVKHNVPMILVSHNIIVNIDEEYPSSISKKMHDLLRYEYGYTGLIVTDSLSMGAITKYTKNISAAVLAVLAGNDIILTSTFEEHIDAVIKAVDNNEIDMNLIEKAAKRVIAWKLKYIYEQEVNNKNENVLFVILYIFVGIAVIVIIIFIIYKCIILNKNKVEKSKEEDIKGEGLITNSQRNTENNTN